MDAIERDARRAAPIGATALIDTARAEALDLLADYAGAMVSVKRSCRAGSDEA